MHAWDDKGEDSLILFTPAEFALLPDGFELESIGGDKKVKGKDYIDDDTRFGHMAFGIRNPLKHAEAELLTKIKLQSL
jgi:hypothetical protein